MASVTFDRASKIYPDGARAVSEVSLDIADGELMVLVGPSGCGKSTALRMLGGLESITEGFVRIGRFVVNALTPRERDLAMIFQNYALYPHMTVGENIAFPLKLRGRPRDAIDTQVRDAARMLGIEGLLARKPASLSGGQRQRVAIGRAIVRQPQAFLMDEPLSNLDAKLRVQMRTEVAELQRTLGITTLYVTHDQVEAMTMGDRVAVMRAGGIEQVGPPDELYARPRNRFVAGFIGTPAMNFLDGIVQEDGVTLTVAGHTLRLPREARPGRVVVGLRPESLEDAALVPDEHRFEAHVELVEQLGAEQLVHLRLPGDVALVGRFDAGSHARPGTQIQVAVDARAIHLFDPDTELAI